MKRKSLLVMLLVALFVPLAMNAQTRSLKKKISRAPRPQLQLEVAGQLQTIEDFQPGKVYHRATMNTRDNVLYSNGFNSQADLSDISIYDNDGDGYNWGWYNSQGVTGVSGDYALGSQSYDNDAGALTPDNWLIMPAVTLPSGNAQYFASVYARSYGGYGETIGIFAAPENDDYIYQVGSDFNLTQDAFVLCEVDLSAYAGQTIEIYIRHYNCTDGFYLFVDDFSIYSRLPEEEITIGSGTSTNAYVPTRTQRRYSLTQQIYTATEIGHTDGGNITSVSFYGNRAATRTLDIYMVNTTQSTIASNTAFHPTTSDRVYSGSVSFTANAWTKITFDTPFEYTGGNVVLIVDDNTGSAANQATNFRVFTANNQAIYIHGAQTNTNTNYNPTSTNLSYTAQNTKNQVKFTMEAEPTPVESITASDLSLIAGFSAQIDYTVLPADATNPAVTFTSANTAVATVSANGVVTGVAAGTTTITLTSVSNPEVSTTINVEVTPFVGLIFDFETDPNEEGWTFVDSDGDGFNWEWEDCSETPHNTPFEGEGCLFSASYDNDNQTALNPDNWAITPAIHILNSPSVVYLYAQGQDASYAAEHFQVYIGTSPDPSSMTAISSEFVATGSYVQYSANIPDTYAGQIVYLAIRHFNVTDMFVLDVDYLVITNAELAPEGILVESISADDVEVVVGGTANITNLEVLPADATNPAVTYTSNNETIATVDANGVVTGVAPGTTTITITANDGSGVTTTINVTVTGIDVTGITASDVTMTTGETATISYTVAPNNATDPSVTFTSANTAIATVDTEGVVTGVAPGTTTITIASVSNPEVTATINVTVNSNPNAAQFTVNVTPTAARPGDVITVECVLNAPTEGTYNGFTGLVLGLHFDPAAFTVNGNPTAGPVASACTMALPGLPNTTHPDLVQYSLVMPVGTPNTTTGLVFTAQFTVLTEVEFGSYTFFAEPTAANNFVYNPGSGATPIQYEYVPSSVVISNGYTKHIIGYNSEEGNVTGNYYLIASPIGNVAPTAVTNMTTGSYDLYYFDQTQELEWINYEGANGNFDMERGKGYLYANSETVDLIFIGTANTNGEVTLTYSEDNPTDETMYGRNLVGNPFAEDAYIEDGRDFYRMNEDGDEIMTDASNGKIDPMEGVFVYAETDNETLTFTTTEPENQGSKAMLAINLSRNSSVIDRAIVRFGRGRTLPKFQLFENSTKIYIEQDNHEYAVVNSDTEGEMPVNFKASEDGSFTIAVNINDVETHYLHLIDNITGADIDLLQTPSYTFTARSDDYASRFKLVFSASADDDNFAFIGNGDIIITDVDANATLQIVDVTGRILFNENAIHSVSTANLAKGVYVLRLINGSDVKTQKIVIK